MGGVGEDPEEGPLIVLQEILGPHLAEQKALIPTIAQEDGPLLILGEEGVGKSLYARHIHAAAEGNKCDLPVVNLATTPLRDGWLTLLGSDFQHLSSTRRSVLEHDGIVLIKHIGAAPHSVQDQLAGALRSGSFIRPGSVRKAKVLCRPIFTLRIKGEERYRPALLADGLFRYLSGARRVTIPPLRERPGDISAIAREALGRGPTPELERFLLASPWPGNVTELKACLTLLRPVSGREGRPADECLLEVAKLVLGIEEGRETSFTETMSRLRQKIAKQALRRTDGNIVHAAQLIGLTPAALRWHLRVDKSPQ